MPKEIVTSVVCLFVLIVCVPSFGAIINVTGNIMQISPPSSVQVNVFESNTTAFLFTEHTSLSLGQGAPVDITTPGLYDSVAGLTPGTIPAGTLVNSYYYHADPVGSSISNIQEYSGTITFDTNVIGIAGSDATLGGSNFLGAPGTLYPTSGQGFEFGPPGSTNDMVMLSADRRTVTIMDFANTASDDLRIITAVSSVPEPGTFWLLSLGLSAALAARVKRSKRPQ